MITISKDNGFIFDDIFKWLFDNIDPLKWGTLSSPDDKQDYSKHTFIQNSGIWWMTHQDKIFYRSSTDREAQHPHMATFSFSDINDELLFKMVWG